MEDQRKELENLLGIKSNKRNSSRKKAFEAFNSKVTKFSDKEVEELQACFKSRHPMRIKIVKRHFQWFPLDPEIKLKYQKNSKISSTLCKLGCRAHTRHKYEEAVRWFSLAALFAPRNTIDLATAYANRSVAVDCMGRTDDALKDITLAIGYGYPKGTTLMKHMLTRRYEIGRELQIRTKDAAFEHNLADKLVKFNEFYEDTFKLRSPNPVAPSVEECVTMKYTAGGRHFVANRDIPIGTTVMVEKPYAAVLTNALNWDVDHCHHCFKRVLHCIPCSNCVFTLYCNERCKKAAVEYHKYECPNLPDLHCNLYTGAQSHFLLAFRIICKMGPHALYEMYSKQKDCDKTGDWQLDDLENSEELTTSDLFAPDSYRAIHILKIINDPSDTVPSIINSLVLAHILETNTKFYEIVNCTKLGKELFRDFIVKILLHHYETFRRNSLNLSHIKESKSVTLRNFILPEFHLGSRLKYDLEQFACSVSGTASWFRHSCCPNLMKVVANTHGVMAYVATRPLVKGQELLISYGPEYGNFNPALQTPQSRREILHKGFGFFCTCIACKYNWPRTDILAKIGPSFCCAACTDKFTLEERMSEKFFEKCGLTGNFMCKTCKFKHNGNNLMKEYQRQCQTLQVCAQLIDTNAPIEAINDLETSLAFFDNNLCPPNYYGLVLGPILYRNAVNQILFFANIDLSGNRFS